VATTAAEAGKTIIGWFDIAACELAAALIGGKIVVLASEKGFTSLQYKAFPLRPMRANLARAEKYAERGLDCVLMGLSLLGDMGRDEVGERANIRSSYNFRFGVPGSDDESFISLDGVAECGTTVARFLTHEAFYVELMEELSTGKIGPKGIKSLIIERGYEDAPNYATS